MPNKTPILGLNTWLESDFVNWQDLNENFEKLDSTSVCRETGTAVASYTGGSVTSVQWRYKKYSDGTVEMSASFPYNTLACNNGTSVPYESGITDISFPFMFSDIYNVQVYMASELKGWVSNITKAETLDHLTLVVLSMTKENIPMNKRLFINVKGVLVQ